MPRIFAASISRNAISGASVAVRSPVMIGHRYVLVVSSSREATFTTSPRIEIVEALRRADVADAALARVEADADADGHRRLPALSRRLGPARIEPDQLLLHAQRGAAGVARVARIGERRVPEGHDGVAHEFIDRAALGEDHLGQGREQLVEEADQLLGGEAFRQRREAAHVGKQQGHLARFAAELQLVVVARELFHQGGCHVMAEGRAHAIPLQLRLDVAVERGGEVEDEDREATGYTGSNSSPACR